MRGCNSKECRRCHSRDWCNTDRVETSRWSGMQPGNILCYKLRAVERCRQTKHANVYVQLLARVQQICTYWATSCHWVHSLFCVIVLYVHASGIIVTWWDEPGEIESYSIWITNHPPSVLWHCWLGHLTCKNIVKAKLTRYHYINKTVYCTYTVHCVCRHVIKPYRYITNNPRQLSLPSIQSR